MSPSKSFNFGSGLLVFGGSFHPIHHVHLQMAYDVAAFFKLREALILPNFQTPGKDEVNLLTPVERFQIATTEVFAFQKNHLPPPFLTVSQIELQKKKASFTIDTLKEIKPVEPKPYLLIGLDQFECFSQWKDPEGILNTAQVCVVNRPKSSLPPDIKFEKKIQDQIDLLKWKNEYPIYYFSKTYDDRSSQAIRQLIQEQKFNHPWLKDYQPSSIEVFKSNL
jgi:nicotinate (nicotinamide) nucleotide adenylyltransferase